MRVLLALVLLLVACVPRLDDQPSLVTDTTILAVTTEPPEAKPGDPVAYSIFVATPDGPLADPAASWSLCTARSALTEDRVIAGACARGRDLAALADGVSTVETAVPEDACRVFGPEGTGDTHRPRDPDSTGGFYQPVRADFGGTVAFGLQRLACNLGNVPLDVANEFRERYTVNETPTLGALRAEVDGRPAALDALPAGATIAFSVDWPAGAAERYVSYDPARQVLVERREEIRASWFATGGSFARGRTGRDEDDEASTSTNWWDAPTNAQTVHLWVVLRDSRGGTAVAAWNFTLR